MILDYLGQPNAIKESFKLEKRSRREGWREDVKREAMSERNNIAVFEDGGRKPHCDQGIQVAPRSWKRLSSRFPSEPPEGQCSPANTLIVVQ